MSAKKSSSIETLRLRPSDIGPAIQACRNGNGRAVFLWGPPGIAKSAVCQQVATANGEAFIDVRLSQMDPTDLRGIPYPVQEWGQHGVSWSAPLVLPRDIDLNAVCEIPHADYEIFNFGNLNPKGSNGIHYCTNLDINVRAIGNSAVAKIIEQSLTSVTVALFEVDATGTPTETMVPGKVRVSVKGLARGLIALEEFNSAPPSVTAAAYQLVLDHRLGEYVVPEGCYLMALGNRETDKGIAFKMPTPIMNRFIHIEQEAGTGEAWEDWFEWAVNARLNAEVIGYLSHFKGHLFEFEPGSAARGFPTPRSWHFVSDVLNNNDYLSDRVTLGTVCGAIGDGIGIQFVEFRKFAADLPKADEILSGRLKKMPELDANRKVSLSYALTTTLCFELKDRAEANKRKNGDSWQTSPERKKWLQEADNFIAFIMENFQTEICVMGARQAISIHRLPFKTTEMKNFEKFAARHKDMIVS